MMIRPMKQLTLPTKTRMTRDLVPDIELTHGRAVVSPFEALRICAHADEPARARMSFNLSQLAVSLVECAGGETIEWE